MILRHDFQLGQQLLLFNSCLKLFSGKLKSRWSGLFIINKVTPFGAVQLVRHDGRMFSVNGQRLKHYNVEERGELKAFS